MLADVLATMNPDKVFDRSALDSLADQVATRIAVHFAEQFLQLLPSRVRRIQDALDAGDGERALDAVLSLKVTSVTVGATGLAGCASAIEGLIRSGQLGSASVRAVELDEEAAAVASAVAGYIESAG